MRFEWAAAWVVWNVFLAGLPVVLAGPLSRRIASPDRRLRSGVGAALLGLAWLLLLPNAAYLLTEGRHLLLDGAWRDLTARAKHDPEALRLTVGVVLLFAAYGTVGLVAFAAALRPVETALRRRFPRLRGGRATLYPLVSLGVWLGLVPRYNSWDAITRPLDVVGSAVYALTHVPTLACILGFAAVLGALTALVYGAWAQWEARRWRVASLLE